LQLRVFWKIYQFENIKTLYNKSFDNIICSKKLISRLGPLVFHEYLLRFGKTKINFAQFKRC